ncbi:MAG: porin family protein [Bacteroidetes bacterium]|nr:porin family protein [Bacteroidota bacterium]
MKKSFLTISLSLIAMMAFSQAKLEIGLKGGLNSSKLNIDEAGLKESASSSFHAGIYTLIKVSKIGIQPEILYSPRKNNIDFGSGNVEQKQVYLDIPIMVKLYLAAGVNLQAGPQIGILTSAESAGVDVKDNLKGSDFSVAFGLGWDAPFGLQANVRYLLGLSDINDAGSGSAKITSRTFQFSLGYRLFKIGN